MDTSFLYETKPMYVMDQPSFLNAAVELETELEPMELLRELKKIEEKVGREESFRNGPRLIDLDILLYDDIEIDESVSIMVSLAPTNFTWPAFCFVN